MIELAKIASNDAVDEFKRNVIKPYVERMAATEALRREKEYWAKAREDTKNKSNPFVNRVITRMTKLLERHYD